MYIGLLLLLFWSILSGQATLFFITIAIFSVYFTILIDRKLFIDKPSIHITSHSILFFFRLLKDMFLSCVVMIKIIWLGSEVVDSCYTVIDADSMDPVGQAVQANAITLTPGTMSMNLKDNKILVHAINFEALRN